MNCSPPSTRIRNLALLALVGVLGPVGAQPIYRCGPERNVYAQQPCADGVPITADDRRSDTQRREAEQTAAREADHAQQLRHERLEREARDAAALRGQRAVAIRGVPETQPSASTTDAWRKSPSAKPKKPKRPTGSKKKRAAREEAA
ncbi:hypothetical protein V4F39_13605 [Aquincola sp. MAHUQ-54]|uniref:DUF4124 domain-containing protein n=1 Tax=Aquincola agrisoli TaxID=3119538 RepID=A0AAW9QHM6_9BURK